MSGEVHVRDLSKNREVLDSLRSQRIAVIGTGMSNMALAKFLLSQGCKVTACDKKRGEELGAAYDTLRSLGIELRLGEGYLSGLDDFDTLFVTPGIPLDLPEIDAARRGGVNISNEIALFLLLCRGKIIGITGSNGKTTTTTLTGRILSLYYDRVFVGGNIGNPLIEQVLEIPEDAKVVMELSSFQLQSATVSPEISSILNIYPNHLDHHRSMEEYIEAKRNILRYQSADDYAILNHDNPISAESCGSTKGKALFFSRIEELEEGAFLSGDDIYVVLGGRAGRICSKCDLKIPGDHNVENVLAASLIASVAGVPAEAIASGVTGFTGVAHRLELVRELDGVVYYNDSKATTPSSTVAALRAVEKPVVLIAGGYDKHLSFDELAEYMVDRVKGLVLMGQTARQIDESVRKAAGIKGVGHPPIVHAASLEDAVLKAKELSSSGDAVLFSPACASYDMFGNFMVRGDRYREIVQSL